MPFDPALHPDVRLLPIAPYLRQITSVLAREKRLVLTAEPGAGKSTVVPLALLDTLEASGKKILMLEPRRIAAASIAARMAELLGERTGERVGYRVRHETRVSSRTRIEVVTEALLTRMILGDPGLTGVGLVIFDEFHERSIHADTAFALTREVLELREDLSVLVMSATMNAERVSRALGGAAVLSCPGRSFPVEVHYRPIPEGRGFEDAFAGELASIAAREEGDILAFLPGTREIRRTGEKLAALAPELDVLPLHGMLPLEEQKRVLVPREGGRKRVILSTSIAETSLTVPGIRIVADSGLTRFTRFHQRTGMDRLVTGMVSVHQADQRKGRAGRTAPGTAYRFWNPAEKLKAETEPEILRSDLAATVLESVFWGAMKPSDLPWLDLPPGPSWSAGETLLRELEAIDGQNTLTGRGRKLLELGISPRLGSLILRGRETGQERLACTCAALLEGRDDSGLQEADIRTRLELLRTGRSSRDFRARIAREVRHLLDASARLRAEKGPDGRRTSGAADRDGSLFSWTPEEEADAGSLLSAGFPDRLARNTGDGVFKFPSGRQAGVRGYLGSEKWLVAPDAEAGDSAGIIYLAAPIAEGDVEPLVAHRVTEERIMDWKGWTVRPRAVRRLGGIVLRETNSAPVSRDELEREFSSRLRKEGLQSLPWNEGTRQMLSRLVWASVRIGEPGGQDFPDFSESVLVETAAVWLAPFLKNPPGEVIDAAVLRTALEARVPWKARQDLEREAPASITLPSGLRKTITYRTDGEPFIAVRIQDVFGMASSPRVCGRPLVLHLLSPAQRPLQITGDLASFWKNTYPEVRKEMRGRYPKHRWPENPLEAEPGARMQRH